MGAVPVDVPPRQDAAAFEPGHSADLRPGPADADGQARNCLFAITETDLRSLLRTGATTTNSPPPGMAPSPPSSRPRHQRPGFLQPARAMSAIGGHHSPSRPATSPGHPGTAAYADIRLAPPQHHGALGTLRRLQPLLQTAGDRGELVSLRPHQITGIGPGPVQQRQLHQQLRPHIPAMPDRPAQPRARRSFPARRGDLAQLADSPVLERSARPRGSGLAPPAVSRGQVDLRPGDMPDSTEREPRPS